ncbi:MAG: threonine--tRNA ligase, partial [Acholeplasmatales bacterium]|nr:threonine--tRNA ligase [Acholeplasmatales bacterium]
LKDGSVKEVESGKLVIEVAKELSVSLAKKCVCASLNDKLVDLKTPIIEDSTLELILSNDPRAFEVLNHSCAHMLAQAMQRLYPGTKFGVGPSIEEGFYYDFSVPETVKIEDLPKIEAEMKKIVKENIAISHYMLSKEEAKAKFNGDEFKCELIDAIDDDMVGIYEQADYSDVCRGPHVISTGVLKNFKLLNVAGAYWRGDSNNEMLTRIYGTCWFTAEELETHLVNLEERKKRDHRKLGKELELFMVSDYGPGFPFWLPKGMLLKNALVNFWTDIHTKAGYQFIQTPIMLNRQLWETSGHWFNYKENMYTSSIDDNEFAIKPMNCPGGMLVYKNSIHSYREFPLRMGELGLVHRHEASGALNGLFRVRTFTQDDAHIFMTEGQIRDEIANIILLYKKVYSVFDLKFHIELSTRPEDKFIGEISTWDIAEKALADACTKAGFDYKLNPGDGAFYGPKLDFKLKDSMNRIWQCGTIQLDMNLPERFDLTYVAEDGSKKRPVMVHRALFGSLERFIGIITEHYAGLFPTWLAPVQVKIIPVNLNFHKEYCDKLQEIMLDNSIRFEVDYREDKLGYKIRESQTKKVPYTLVIGDNEVQNNLVTYRKHGSQAQTTVTVEEFVELIKKHVRELN